MTKSFGYAAPEKKATLEPFAFERRAVGPNDILIEIQFCGVCHSDIHQVNDDWGGSIYPMVPGHEIVGRVAEVGANVEKFKEGDTAGVGCMVDSCRRCASCEAGLEQFCAVHTALTYNGTEMDETTPTFGGYSTNIVVDESFALKISPEQNLAAVAPLLCAGITTYSPLKRFDIKHGSKVGIVGLGGLGHMGVKFAVAMGADVTVFSTSPTKEEDARKLGAQHFVVTKEPGALEPLASQFDFILDTVSAPHDLNVYLELLKYNGALVLVGIPGEPAAVLAPLLVMRQRNLTGSAIGGIPETQEMLDYCAAKNIVSDIEMIGIDAIARAYERTVKGDVRYRFVIDIASLKSIAANVG
ncbi:MAG: NAD(P)-dependent alcohol dehydrogenase [Pyrinomonadaceae bacterium]|nr:NAD(P)-dependent alcohol dehydrogenase [Pyrinomonadaceae bacterium]